MCVSPCNCGSNADCKVFDHYPSCICKPGYYGNPLQGCIKSKYTLLIYSKIYKPTIHIKSVFFILYELLFYFYILVIMTNLLNYKIIISI